MFRIELGAEDIGYQLVVDAEESGVVSYGELAEVVMPDGKVYEVMVVSLAEALVDTPIVCLQMEEVPVIEEVELVVDEDEGEGDDGDDGDDGEDEGDDAGEEGDSAA